MISKKAVSLTALTLLFLGGCASHEEKSAPVKKTYSAETERTFEEIEREQVLETYRRMRQENWEERQAEREREQERRQYRRIRPKPAPARPAPTPRRASKRSGDPEAIQVEIEQNMALFCMKMSGNRRFENDNDCQAFTQNILFECSSKHDEDDKGRVACVKGSLK